MSQLRHRSTLFPYTPLFRSSEARAARLPMRPLRTGVDRPADRLLLQKARSRARTRGLRAEGRAHPGTGRTADSRSEEHTSELQSHVNLECRRLLEIKKTSHV